MAAIYMWFFGEELIITTTPYPIEVVEGLVFSAAPDQSSMEEIASDYVETTHAVLSGTYVQKRWFYTDGPYLDEVEMTHTVVDGTYIQTRWFFEDGPYNDEVEMTHVVVDGTHLQRRVFADSPDESIQITCTPLKTSSMDSV